MKIGILMAMCLLIPTMAMAGVSYEKLSDSKVKITKTTVTESVDVKEVTIAQLKTEKENLRMQKASETDSFNKRITSIDALISEVDTKISEAGKLGVKEIDKDGNII